MAQQVVQHQRQLVVGALELLQGLPPDSVDFGFCLGDEIGAPLAAGVERRLADDPPGGHRAQSLSLSIAEGQKGPQPTGLDDEHLVGGIPPPRQHLAGAQNGMLEAGGQIIDTLPGSAAADHALEVVLQLDGSVVILSKQTILAGFQSVIQIRAVDDRPLVAHRQAAKVHPPAVLV